MSLLSLAESSIRFPWVIDTTFERTIYSALARTRRSRPNWKRTAHRVRAEQAETANRRRRHTASCWNSESLSRNARCHGIYPTDW